MASQFYLQIITPERTFYQGEVESVIIPTVGGQMGVLKGNIPLITALQSGEVKIKKDGKWHYAANSDGFAEVTPDKVLLFCETIFWPDEMEMEQLKEKERHQREEMQYARDKKAYTLAKTSLMRTHAKINVKQEHQHDILLDD